MKPPSGASCNFTRFAHSCWSTLMRANGPQPTLVPRCKLGELVWARLPRALGAAGKSLDRARLHRRLRALDAC
eukprot:6576803-Prorocentrum_lima.AAC.1